jgi:hypothetical protein
MHFPGKVGIKLQFPGKSRGNGNNKTQERNLTYGKGLLLGYAPISGRIRECIADKKSEL